MKVSNLTDWQDNFQLQYMRSNVALTMVGINHSQSNIYLRAGGSLHIPNIINYNYGQFQ